MKLHESFEKYADVAIQIGLNLQKGQQLIISAPVEAVDLVRVVTRKAYEAGASLVTTFYNDGACDLLRYTAGSDEYLTTTNGWMADGIAKAFGDGAARLAILGKNPTLFKDVDPSKLATAGRARSAAYRDLMRLVTDSASNWSIISYATVEWAEQVFPDYSKIQAVENLWEAIFKACRVDLDDPIAAWEEHNAKLHVLSKKMNDLRFDALRYAAPGTDITIGLADGHIWEGGAGTTIDGRIYNANIPTEEIFTTPHRGKVDGVIVSTKPLLYRGTMIDGIRAVFKDGKVVEVTATDGQQVLLDMINEDEGASRLGEVALVPASSPISQSGILFKETLFDENSASHLAFGTSYTKCISEIPGETPEEKLARGANKSSVHTDWMVGSSELNVYGIKDGAETLIMERGEWVI